MASREHLTPEQRQLLDALAIAAAGRHNVILLGGKQRIEQACAWIAHVLPVPGRDDVESVERAWSRHGTRERPAAEREQAPVVRADAGMDSDARKLLLGTGDEPGLCHLGHTGALVIDRVDGLRENVVEDVCRMAAAEEDYRNGLGTRTVVVGTIVRSVGSTPDPGRRWDLFDVGWEAGPPGGSWEEPDEAVWRTVRLWTEAGRNRARQRPLLPGERVRVRAGSMNLDQVERNLFLITPEIANWWNGLDLEPVVRRRRGAVTRTVADLGGRVAATRSDFTAAARHTRLPEALAAGQ